jgi:hypothetical protein
MVNGEEYMILFKSKSFFNPNRISMEIAPYYYYTNKSCYLKRDLQDKEIKPFLSYSNNNW